MGRTLAALLACAGLLACGDADVALLGSGREPRPVRVETVRPQPYAPAVTTDGTVEADARIQLAFHVGGFVARFGAEEGAHVEAGAPLAELERGELERSVELARAELERARARLAEARLAHARGHAAEARAHLDAARAELRRAELALEEAETHLEAGVLRAPLSGYVERRLVEAHEYVEAGTPVAVLLVLDAVRVRASLPEALRRRVRVGGEVVVRVAADPRRAFPGRIARIGVTADPASGGVPFEVELANPDLALRPRTRVRVEVPVGPAAAAHSVPRSAVLPGVGARPFSFVVEGEGPSLRVTARPVSLGPVHGDRVLVASGLATGERVVIGGQDLVTVGDRVRVVAERAGPPPADPLWSGP